MKGIVLLLIILSFSIATYAQTPTISGFSPTSGPVGTLVTITGYNLGSPTAFTIGGVTAIMVSNTGTTLVGLVMPGAVTGTVSVTTNGGVGTGSINFKVTATPYPSIQQGDKLVGTGAEGDAWQGFAVSISADGNTAIVGGYQDDGLNGAAWVYTRSGTKWTQQGDKLVGTGSSGPAWQGYSVSISADGNTALVGGNTDNGDEGAAWVFTRSGTTWAQQGNKLVGNDAVGPYGYEGYSVSISADGNTAIVGGPFDSSSTGAAWIYTRSDTTWTQQGHKLVGAGAVGAAFQGSSVAISKDGNTVIFGGQDDNSFTGAAWVYTRSDTTWTQQGSKLVGTGVTLGQEGVAVALSADGNTAILGGYGATFAFTRSGTTWTQQGNYMVGSGATVNSDYGASVSLSADGNTLIVGGEGDSNNIGAAWVFTRSGGTWEEQGGQLIGTGVADTNADQGSSVAISADGNTAIVGGFADSITNGAAWIYISAALPQGSLTANGPFCISGTGQLTWTATAGTGPFTIIYNDGTANDTATNVVSGTPFNVFTEPVTASTTYTLVSVTDVDSAVSSSGFTEDSATITINLAFNDTITTSICYGTAYDRHSTTGTFIDTFTVASGCDSIRTLNLTVNAALSSVNKQQMCEGDTFQGHTTSGNYVDTLVATGGCDSIVTLELQVDSLPSSVTLSQIGDTLIAIQGYTTYTWYRDSTSLISNGSNIYIISLSGNYYVQISNGDSNCFVNSSVLMAYPTGIENVIGGPGLSVYPNPAVDVINISLTGIREALPLTIKVYNTVGQEVYDITETAVGKNYSTQLDLAAFSKGVYLLQILQDDWEITQRIVRE